MTDAELRDAAVSYLKKTTVGWNKVAAYPPDKLATTNWGKAMDLLAQIASPAPPPPPPSGNVYFDFSEPSAVVPPWESVHERHMSGVTSPQRITAVGSDGGVNPRSGSKMCRIEVRGGDYAPWTTGREITMAQGAPVAGSSHNGDEFWVGTSLYFPSGYQPTPCTPDNDCYANSIFEMHAPSGQQEQAPLHLIINMKIGSAYGLTQSVPGFMLDLHTQSTGYNPRMFRLGDFVTGRWVDFVFHIKWSSASDGIYEGWMDGVKSFSWTGQTYNPQNTLVYPMLGLYRKPVSWTNILYCDGFRLGSSYAAVSA